MQKVPLKLLRLFNTLRSRINAPSLPPLIFFSKKNPNLSGIYPNLSGYLEKAPSNKTPTLSKSMNMELWVVGTSNQLFIGGSST